MLIIIIWVIFTLSCYLIAKNKGIGKPLWFLIGLIVGIVTLGAVVVLPDNIN